jgi:hypothetical protein
MPVTFEREIYDPHHHFSENGTDEGIDSGGTEPERMDDFYKAVSELAAEGTDAPNDLVVAADALQRIVAWAAHPLSFRRKDCAQILGMRLMAALVVVNPETFGGIAITELCKRLGYAPNRLSSITAEFSRVFGILNRAQQAHYSKARRNETDPNGLF